jgi:hypothetical protein
MGILLAFAPFTAFAITGGFVGSMPGLDPGLDIGAMRGACIPPQF